MSQVDIMLDLFQGDLPFQTIFYYLRYLWLFISFMDSRFHGDGMCEGILK